jgi:D-alanyl-D-alanine dipeptidase
MKKIFTLAVMLLSIFAFGAAKHTQMIVVTSDDYNTSNAKLQRYHLKNSKWQKVGQEVDIKIGRNGMGWGLGLHKIPKNASIIKKEGDGKSPIGIFKLGNAFGYEPFDTKYPYNVMQEYHHCVDDGKSRFYNRIINSNMRIVKDYTSYENMKFPANYYKYGIVVNHNPDNIPGRGSCIFMHIKEIPTSGCDAMSEDEIKEVIAWLKKEANPILVQAPKSEIKQLLDQVK